MKILVVVDMQNDFITGSLGTPEAQAIVPNVARKVDEALVNGDLVVYTRDTHFDDYLATNEGLKLPVEHCIEGTEGWEIADEVLPTHDADKVVFVNKRTFGDLELPNILCTLMNGGPSNYDEIELVGLCTDICVVSNALILKAYFYNTLEVSVDATCCAGVTPATHETALKTMEMCQVNVKRG